MGQKKYKERRLPSFHKNDAVAYKASWHDEWWDTKPISNHKSWKKHRKTQYHRIPHFDLYTPWMDKDESEYLFTPEQVEQHIYLLEHYDIRVFSL